MKRLSRCFDLGIRTWRVFLDTDMVVCSGYATLYILLAGIPMSVLTIALVGLLPESYLRSFLDVFLRLFPSIPQVQSLINGILFNIKSRAGAMLVSISAVTLLWSAATGVNAIQIALSRIRGSYQPVVIRRAASFLYTILFIVMVPVFVVFRALRNSLENLIISLADQLQMPEAAETVVRVFEKSGLITFFAMLLIILLAYTFLPGKGGRSWKHQLPGAVFTAVLWGLFSALFDFFIGRFWTTSFLYGSLASIFLLALWLKTIVTILFLGASLNQALYELGYWKKMPVVDPAEEIDRSGRIVLCLYLMIAMIILACVLKTMT